MKVLGINAIYHDPAAALVVDGRVVVDVRKAYEQDRFARMPMMIGATSADIEQLGEDVRRRVREASGIELEWEIQRVGV